MAKATLTYDYQGARVLVTGGTSGIGNAIALAYREANAEVYITGTRGSAVDYDDVDTQGMHYTQLAVSDRDALYAMPEQIGALDILINNAGGAYPKGLSEWDAEGFDESIRVNLLSVFHLTNAFLPSLRESTLPGGAGVIGIASMTSYFGLDLIPGYGASKAGLVQMVKTLAMAEAQHGVRVNAVAAGLTHSRLTAAMKEIPDSDAAMMARTPQRRWGEAREVADAVLFLTSDRASYITGHTMNVDGGFSISG